MIPVFQTRSTTEALGNCFEACLASILEIPLARIPDKAAYLPDDWADQVAQARERGDVRRLELDVGDWIDELRGWLLQRGVLWLELAIDHRGMTEADWRRAVAEMGPGYWIGVHASAGEGAHAIVYLGEEPVHNPARGLLGAEGLEELIAAHLLVVADPRRVVRELGREMLPDLAGHLDALVEQGVADGRLSASAGAAWRGEIDYPAGRVIAHRSRPRV